MLPSRITCLAPTGEQVFIARPFVFGHFKVCSTTDTSDTLDVIYGMNDKDIGTYTVEAEFTSMCDAVEYCKSRWGLENVEVL